MKKITLAILLILLPSQVLAMGAGAKVAFNFVRKALHYGIAFAPTIAVPKVYIEMEKEKKIKHYQNNAPDHIQQIVTSACEQENNTSTIKSCIKDCDDFYAVTHLNTILIPKDKISEINAALYKKTGIIPPGETRSKKEIQSDAKDLDADTLLNATIGALQHEKTHIERHAQHRLLIPQFIIPFITHYGLKKIPCMYPLKSTLSLLGGLTKFTLNYLLTQRYMRYEEQKADDGIKSNKALLNAELVILKKGIKEHNDNCTILLKMYGESLQNSELSITQKLSMTTQRIFLSLIYKYPLFLEHPTPATRLAVFEKRLAEIEHKEELGLIVRDDTNPADEIARQFAEVQKKKQLSDK